MAHPDEALARDGFAAFARGDMEAVGQFLAEDTRWHFPGQNPLSGDYEGLAEVLAVFGKIFEPSGGTFQSELHDVLASDDHIVMLVTDRAERLGRALHDNVAQVLDIRDGKMTDVCILTCNGPPAYPAGSRQGPSGPAVTVGSGNRLCPTQNSRPRHAAIFAGHDEV